MRVSLSVWRLSVTYRSTFADELGHADHLVHPHRDGPHARRNGGRQSCARFNRRELHVRDRLVLEHRQNHAAIHDFVHGGVCAGQRRA
jgi:hypothetical protein